MINYRSIFNPDYNYIGIILILIIIALIFLNNSNFRQSLHQIGFIITISGFVTLIIAFLLDFVVDIVLPARYQLFVEVISNNIYENFWKTSIMTIFLGGFILIINKIFHSRKLVN